MIRHIICYLFRESLFGRFPSRTGAKMNWSLNPGKFSTRFYIFLVFYVMNYLKILLIKTGNQNKHMANYSNIINLFIFIFIFIIPCGLLSFVINAFILSFSSWFCNSFESVTLGGSAGKWQLC